MLLEVVRWGAPGQREGGRGGNGADEGEDCGEVGEVEGEEEMNLG